MHSRPQPPLLPAVSNGSSEPDEHAVSLPGFSQNDDGTNFLRRQDCGVTSSAPSPEEADETSSSLASSLLSTSSTVLVGDRYGEGGVSSDRKHRDISRLSPSIPCCGNRIVLNTSSPCPRSTSPITHNEEDVLVSAAIQFEISRETRMAAALMIANRDHLHKRKKDSTALSCANEAAASTDAHTSQSQVTRVSPSSASVSTPSGQSVTTSSSSQKTKTEDCCPSSPSTAGEEDEDVEHLILRAKDLACRLAPRYLGLVNDGGSSAAHHKTSQECLGAAFVTMGSTNRMVRVWNRSDSRKACAIKFFGETTGQYISREKEKCILRLLAANKLGKDVLATFEEYGGGLIEGWLAGGALEPLEMVQQAPRIARELARLHTIDITGHYPPPSGGSSPAASSGSSSSSPCHPEGSRSRDEHVAGEKDTKEKAGGSQKVQSDLWITTWKLLQLCKEQQESARKVVQSGRSVCSDDIPGSRGPDGSPLTPFFRRILMFDLRSIEELLRRLQTLAMEVDSPIVLCHGDLLCGNIIKTDEGDICFIDFEYAGFMERGFDIANHFAEHAGIECDYTKCPDEAHQDAFLMEYLREARRLRRSATSHRQQADNGESASSSSFTSSSLHRTTEDDRDFSSAPDRQQGHQKRRKDEDQDTDKEQQGTSLKTSCEEREKEDEEDLKKEFRALKREVQVFFSVSHVMWGLWGLVQAVHVLPREYNFWRFAFDRLAAAISPPIPSLAPPSLGPTAPSLSGGNDKE